MHVDICALCLFFFPLLGITVVACPFMKHLTISSFSYITYYYLLNHL